MKLAQWGTYSVRDHLGPRPFVADVLLFDKLVIPRPATEEELQAEDFEKPRGDQMNRWRRRHWDPDAQRRVLDILGEFDLAVELPWGGKAEQNFDKLYNNPDPDMLECDANDLTRSIQFQVDLAKQQIPDEAAYVGTGGVLALYVADKMADDTARKLLNRARTPGVPVEAVIAYGSYDRFMKDQAVQEVARDANPPAVAPYAMFGWEFFVPDDTFKSDAELLRLAAKLASKSDFIETRQFFYGWLKQMYDGEVDREDAKEKMLKMLDEYTRIVRGSGLATTARYAAKAAQILAPLAGLAGHQAGVAAGVVTSGAVWAVERLIPAPQVPERLRSAAVLYDARKFFRKH